MFAYIQTIFNFVTEKVEMFSKNAIFDHFLLILVDSFVYNESIMYQMMLKNIILPGDPLIYHFQAKYVV